MIPTRKSKQELLRRELLTAGYFHRKALEEFLGLRNFCVAAWIIFIAATIVLLADAHSHFAPKILMIGCVVLVLIYVLPRLILSAQAKSRAQTVLYALPDALDMINMMVTAGLPVRAAIKRAGQELKSTHEELACEMAIIDQHTEAGSLEQALKNFADRIDLPGVVALSTIVRHADQLGGNVAAAFRDFADSIRRSRRQRAEERGNKASIKLLFPVVLFLAPPIYILLLGPAALELRTFMARENRAGGVLSQETQQNRPLTAPQPAGNQQDSSRVRVGG